MALVEHRPSLDGGTRFGTMTVTEFMTDTVGKYIPHDRNHQAGFMARLRDQGYAHGHKISKDSARAVANVIGPDLKVTMLSGDLGNTPNIVKAMTITGSTASAEGPLVLLEDIITIREARGQGSATKLIQHNLIDAWETVVDVGHNLRMPVAGYTWEMGRDNERAGRLYSRIDPTFDASIPHAVWTLSERQCANLGDEFEVAADRYYTAHLGTLGNDLNRIAPTLFKQPDASSDYMSQMLAQQSTGNGLGARSFVCVSDSGAFAMAHVGTSTFFQASKRADVHLYLSDSFKEHHVSDLMRCVCFEMCRRSWRGEMHIEFSGNMRGLDASQQAEERRKVAEAQKVLKLELGGEPLVHAGSEMIPYSITGERFVKAVIEAVQALPERRMSEEARQRLVVAAKNHGLSID